MRFEPPSRTQGQPVTESYARSPDGLRAVRRTYDARDRTATYAVADLSEDDDPWLSLPRVAGGWRPLAAAELPALGIL